MTVPRRTVPRPNETSPEMVKWSSSSSEGIVLNRFWNAATFLNASPSLMTGVERNMRSGFMTRAPPASVRERGPSQSLCRGSSADAGSEDAGQGRTAELVQVTLDEEQVTAALDGQEARARDVDAVRSVEVLDGRADGRLELDDGLALVALLAVVGERSVEWSAGWPSSKEPAQVRRRQAQGGQGQSWTHWLTMISRSMPSFSMMRLIARRLTHRLLVSVREGKEISDVRSRYRAAPATAQDSVPPVAQVAERERLVDSLKILNLRTDLKSSTWSLGTWAISRRRTLPS